MLPRRHAALHWHRERWARSLIVRKLANGSGPNSQVSSVPACASEKKVLANAERNGELQLFLKDCFKACFCYSEGHWADVQLMAMREFLKVLTFSPSADPNPQSVRVFTRIWASRLSVCITTHHADTAFCRSQCERVSRNIVD